jgi:spermidine/putrescine transport system permease protein
MRNGWGTRLLKVVTVLGFVYLFVPLVTIAVFSFNDPAGRFNTSWQGFTFDNWLDPFGREDFTDALIVSLQVAFVACIIATILGGFMALALSKYRFRGGGAINLLLVLPLTTPEVVLGSSLFTLFFNQGVKLGFWTVVIAHALFCVSFVALTVKARIRGFDWTLEDAAADLGASPTRTFIKVTLPLITPGIVAAFLLSLALSIDDYIITSFVAGSVSTFPREVFDSAKVEIPPQVHVLATLIMLVSIGIIVAGTMLGNRKASRAAT